MADETQTVPPQTALGAQPPHVEANSDPNVDLRSDKLFKQVQGSLDAVSACIDTELARYVEKDGSPTVGDPSVPALRSLFAHMKNVLANERNDHTLR